MQPQVVHLRRGMGSELSQMIYVFMRDSDIEGFRRSLQLKILSNL